MKTLLVCSALILITASLSYGQTVNSSLVNDVDFPQSLLKVIRYPSVAQREAKVAKVYVGFNLDEHGKIADIDVLNKGSIEAYFGLEVDRSMKLLPLQQPRYAGYYVLPIVFDLEDSSRDIKQGEEDASFVQSLDKDYLLPEVHVKGYTTANR